MDLVIYGFMKNKPKKTNPRHKRVYHVRNWSEYDRALVNRGSINIWIDTDTLKQWKYEGPTHRGAQFVYSDFAIQCVLVVKEGDEMICYLVNIVLH